MKLSHLGGLLGLALAVTVGSLYADSQSNAQTYSDQQAGVVGSDVSLKDNAQAKKVIGPQSVMLQTSLLSAKAQLEGLKSQLALSDTSKPDTAFLNQLKTYNRGINDTIKDAANHESNVMKGLAKSYPQIANAEEITSLNYSMDDLQKYYKSWSNKTKERSYWQDKYQVNADLDSLNKRLDKAINQSKSFNANQFDISVG